MRKLLTTLLLTPNYLKQSNLDKKILTTFLLLLTTHLLLSYYFVRIRVFYMVTSIYQCYSYFAHLINKASKMYIVCM